MNNLEVKVWNYLLGNRNATTKEVAKATGASVKFVNELIARISSPNWREEVSSLSPMTVKHVTICYLPRCSSRQRRCLLMGH